MARYKATAPQSLIEKIKANYTISNRAAANALNKTATYAVDESVDLITRTVKLQPSYVKKHLRVAQRASPGNLAVVIRASERETLLSRYPYSKSRSGIRVAVNSGGGFSNLRGAFRVTGLRGSGADGIAMNNKRAAEFFKLAASRGKSTPAKSAKLAKLIKKAVEKPRGVTVLHSRSVNQLFLSVRNDVQPKAADFLTVDFLEQFNRLKRK